MCLPEYVIKTQKKLSMGTAFFQNYLQLWWARLVDWHRQMKIEHNKRFFHPLFPHIPPISVFASKMALLGFYVIPLFLPLPLQVVKHAYAHANKPLCERECVHSGERKKEGRRTSQQNKTLCHGRDWNPQTLSPEPSTLTTGPWLKLTFHWFKSKQNQ